jgi:hypothetical protein
MSGSFKIKLFIDYMNNTELYVDKNYFEILCISDYMHFIYSFYSIFIKNPVALDFLHLCTFKTPI